MSGSSITRDSFYNLIAGAGPWLWESHIARHCAELLQEAPKTHSSALLCTEPQQEEAGESLEFNFP